jgi:hypothetical protein
MFKTCIAVVTLLLAVSHAQIILPIPLPIFGESCTLISGGLWSSAACWAGSLLPSLLGTAQVIVNKAVDLTCDQNVNVGALTYSRARTAVKDNLRFSVGTCNWQGSGNFSLGSNSEYNCRGTTTVYPAAAPAPTISGYSNTNSRIKIESAGKIAVAQGAKLYTKNCALAGGRYEVAPAATLYHESCRVTAPTTVQGSGECHISGTNYIDSDLNINTGCKAIVESDTEYKGAGSCNVAGSHESRQAHKIANKVRVQAGGEYHVSGAGSAQIGYSGQGGELEFNGNSKCKKSGTGAQSHYQIGSTSGAAAYLRFRGSESAPCTIEGGNYEVKPTGNLNVESASKTYVRAATNFKGTGKVNVYGHLACEAPLTSDSHIDVKDNGKLNFNTAYQHTVKSYACAPASETIVRASSTGFKAVKVNSNASYNGKLTVDAGSYAPTSRVTLVDCASATGRYSSVNVVSAGATAKGKVVYDGSKVCYEPL